MKKVLLSGLLKNDKLVTKLARYMKLVFILVFICSLQVSAKVYSQERFTLNMSNVSVDKVLNKIQKESDYRFFYNYGYLKHLDKVSIIVKNETLSYILDKLLDNTLSFRILEGNLVVISPKENQLFQHSIEGIITDENGVPLSGVSVQVKGTNQGVLTDVAGKFKLIVSDDAILTISFVGYETQEVTVGNRTDVNIRLKVSVSGLNEVVVVGYGTQKKRDVTGTISTVKGDDFKNLPVSNVASALQGLASGVGIVRDDGSPGSVPSIRIRGTGTINNSDPLIVIDGVPAGGLDDVNPDDIASVEILKDASSSAIYGSRAANGVVLVTTKKGSFNQPMKTTVNLYTGTKKAIKYIDMLTAPDLATLKKEAYTNDGLAVPSVWDDPNYSVQRTDWQRALLGTGKVQNADIAIRGGNANSTYSFSGNYYDEKGMIANSYFKRYNFRINSEHKIGSRIRVGENITYSNTLGHGFDTKSTQTGLVWSAIRFNPAIPVTNPDGSWGTSQADNQLGDINNPIATVAENTGYNKGNRILANGFAELEIIPGLKLRANYGFDQSIGEGYGFTVATPSQTRGPSISSLGQNFNKSQNFLEEYFLTYSKEFNHVHKIDLVGGYSSQVFEGNYFSASRSGFSDTSADQRVLNLGNSSSAGNAGGNSPSSGLQSYFARANYAFESKYLLTATMRADGSSKFAPGKRWGYFPAFSVGWRISDENFFRNNFKAINSLKITGGWGQLGNQNIGDFQYLSIIGLGGSYSANFGTNTVNQNGAVITSLANPNITWERAVMTNISLEFTTFNNHLTGTVTYFNKNTTDMLVRAQLVETYGAQVDLPDDGGNITLPNVNLGQLNNHGVEIDLNYQNSVGKLSYSFGGNGSFLSNKVTKLYGNTTYLGSTPYGRENTDISRTYEGQPLASFYGFKTDGLYQSQSDIDKDQNIANDPNKANIIPGDVRFVDINGDGVIDDKDRVRLGDPNPGFVYGFHGSVAYSNFDFSFNFAGVADVQLYNADKLAGLDASSNFNWYADQKNRWHGEGTSNSVPILTRTNLNNNYRSSDLWVQSGAYLS
ncbi:MAG TPA: TonB-dependent receptor, partial [Hanamia sp.]|nr:TonB-dependent receptor [Hanamia sp.]